VKIKVILSSQPEYLLGKDNVLAYLRSVLAQQEEIFTTVAEIVFACAGKTDFEAIISQVYAYESPLMKRVLKINYPRSVSFIDVYVYLYLKEYLLPATRDITALQEPVPESREIITSPL